MLETNLYQLSKRLVTFHRVHLALATKKQQLLVVATVGKTSDVLLHDAQYKIEKATR